MKYIKYSMLAMLLFSMRLQSFSYASVSMAIGAELIALAALNDIWHVVPSTGPVNVGFKLEAEIDNRRIKSQFSIMSNVGYKQEIIENGNTVSRVKYGIWLTDNPSNSVTDKATASVLPIALMSYATLALIKQLQK